MMNNIIKKLPNLVIQSSNRGGLLINTNKVSLFTKSVITTQPPQYSTLSKKKFAQIKEKRDEETRHLKEEKERLFIQQNKISIDELPFDAALQNVTEKFTKYHALSNNLVGTMFRKVQSVDELHQLLKFYKSMKNSNPNYFKASHVQYIYYAFLRTQQIPLFAEILIHSDKFQIFPKMNIIIKVISQLLISSKEGGADNNSAELASNLLSIYKIRFGITDSFMPTLSKSLVKSGSISTLLPLLSSFPINADLNLGEDASKLLIRDSYVFNNGSNISKTYKIITNFTIQSEFEKYDNQTKSTFITFEIIANPIIDQHKYSTSLSSNNQELSQLVVANFQKLLNDDKVSDNTKVNVKRAIDNFNNKSLKDSLKSYL